MDAYTVTFYVASAAATITAVPVVAGGLGRAWSFARRIRVQVIILPPSA